MSTLGSFLLDNLLLFYLLDLTIFMIQRQYIVKFLNILSEIFL